MELIPILSLIILTATISTFILAVGAYILYKLREKKGKIEQAAQPATVPAELLTPAPMYAEQQVVQPALRRTMVEQPFRDTSEYQRPAFIPSQERAQAGPELKPSFGPQTQGFTESRYQRPTQEGFNAEPGAKKKMMRYTSDGYIEPSKDDKDKKEENLRWR